MNPIYRLDKNITQKQSFKEADDHYTENQECTPSERLNRACFLINQIFCVNENTKMDKSHLTKRKFKNGESI